MEEDYYEFAENDYYGIKKNIEAEIYFTGMCSLIQNTCERFLKHLIKSCLNEDDYDIKQYIFIMRTHSLRNLCNFLMKELEGLNLNKAKICQADGYYFSSRYPGKDAFIAEKNDILLCWEALQECKRNVDEYLSNNK